MSGPAPNAAPSAAVPNAQPAPPLQAQADEDASSPEGQAALQQLGQQQQTADDAQNNPLPTSGFRSTSALGPQTSPAQQASQAHHGILGRLAESLFTGKTTQYTDQNGKVVANQVPDTKGQIFRSLVGGAILGLAASGGTVDAQGRSVGRASDLASGIGRGAGAVMQQRQAQDQNAYERAQQGLKNQQAQSAEDRAQQIASDQHLQRQVALAHSDLEDYKLARDLDTHGPDTIGTANTMYDARADKAIEAGGQPASITIDGEEWNGVPGNADNFYQAYAKNPDQFKAPDGYDQIKTISVNTNGLHYDQHRDPQTGQVISRWLDKDGSPVDMDKRTTITVYNVPIDAFTRVTPHSGAEINALAGTRIVDPDKTYPTTLNTLTAVGREGISRINAGAAKTRASAAQTTANARASGAGKPADPTKQIRAQIAIAKDKLDASNKTFDDDGAAAANAQLSDLYKQLDQVKRGQSPTTNTQQVTPPPGQSVIYDPKGVAHFVQSGLVPQYLSSPTYKGWSATPPR